MAERIRASKVAEMTGLELRTVQELSALGTIPSAAKLGGTWTYDPVRVRGWIRQQERDTWPAHQESPPTSTSAAMSGGDVSRLPAASIEAAYEHLIGGKRRGGSRRGGSSSNARS